MNSFEKKFWPIVAIAVATFFGGIFIFLFAPMSWKVAFMPYFPKVAAVSWSVVAVMCGINFFLKLRARTLTPLDRQRFLNDLINDVRRKQW